MYTAKILVGSLAQANAPQANPQKKIAKINISKQIRPWPQFAIFLPALSIIFVTQTNFASPARPEKQECRPQANLLWALIQGCSN